MTFDSAQHPRTTDGKFAEKVGLSSDVVLERMDFPERTFSKHWPPLSDEIGLNGYSQVQVARMLQSEDVAGRRMRAWDALADSNAVGAGRPLNTFRPPGAEDFEKLVENQGIVGVVKSVVRQPDGLYRHEMLLARGGFYGANRGRFVGLSSSAEPMTAGAAVRTAIAKLPFLGQDAEFNEVALSGLYSSDEAGEERELYDAYAQFAVRNREQVTEPASSLKEGEVVRPTEGGAPGVINRISSGGSITRIDYMDGRVDVVESNTEMDRW
jgi:hypothetical protein